MNTISSASSKIETLLWYVARPALHKELLRRVFRLNLTTERSLKLREREKEEGTAWCKSIAISKEKALQKLGIERGLRSLEQEAPELWQTAHKRRNDCPVLLGGPAELELLYTLVNTKQYKRVLETGVAAGWSTLAILAALPAGGELISVDMPYAKRGNEAYVGCVVPDSLRTPWTLLRLPDRDALPKIAKESKRKNKGFDLVHYDSDKSIEGRNFAYPILYELLNAGGILFSDDIEDNLAFKYFSERQNIDPIVVEKETTGNFAGILLKNLS